MNAEDWHNVDRYLNSVIVKPDATLTATLKANEAAGLPAIDVSPAHGKMLMLLVQLSHAKRVLEIGTLGGYSTTWLARGVGEGGRVVSLEAVPKHADVARSNIAHAGLSDRVEVRLGPAAESLAALVDVGGRRFDFVFIDADKASNAKYLEWALMLTASGSVIVCDNVVRSGRVLDESGLDDDIVGTRSFLELVGSDPRLEGTVIQTVGLKGWDGFALAVVK